VRTEPAGVQPSGLQRRLGDIVVTGGASGLGAAVADAIAENGGTPIIVDIAAGASAHEALTVDLADASAAFETVRRRADQGVDGLVTAAGIDFPGQLLDVAPEDWNRVVAVNLLGTVAVVRAALPSLIERRGRIVTVASTLAHRGVADATAYCASKFGVVGFTRALTAETKGRVGVTLLTPGGMNTGFFDGRDEKYRPGPDARLCDPREVAEAVVFALSRPPECEIKELVVAGPTEESWP
jgi:NAD(P)-dependent dehydrogenase (short-subunit alcohol dehydrogenase family)